MRDYLKLFDEIVEIMHQDYAGKDEKVGWDQPELFRNQIIRLSDSKQLDDESFYKLVDDYLIDFKDGHVIWFPVVIPLKNSGFRVRRYENSLYVTKVLVNEITVKEGWKIIKVDGIDIETLGRENVRRLRSEIMERQKWNVLIADADNVTFQLENGELLSYAVEKYNMKRIEPKYEMRMLNDNILYMCFEDFADPDAILGLINTNRHLMEQTPYWIVDVRNNAGGSDNSYYPLLPYLFSKGEARKSEDLYYLMTERNCDTRIQFLRSYMEKISENMNAKAGIEGHIRLFESNRGKEFIKLESEDDFLMKFFDETTINPKKVIVMTDTFCGSSGDQFIYDVKQASKVTVIGRPTTGILDYSNLTSIVIDNAFQFMYPTSKMGSVLEKRFTYNGIEPHIYIPWTPEHIESDLDLKEAIEILNRL